MGEVFASPRTHMAVPAGEGETA